MIFGFNTEVRIGTSVFHVQTEDRGAQKHLIDTTVYMGGRLIHRRKISYEELLESPNFTEAALRQRLEEQHRAVIDELRSGYLTFEAREPAPAAAPPPPAAPGAPVAERAPEAEIAEVPPAPPDVAEPAAPAPVFQEAAAQLLNPTSWYAAGTATLKIDVKSKTTNRPLADAMLQVIIQSPTGPINFAAKSDKQGRVELVFPLPHMGAGGAELVIKTPGSDSEDEIRYTLRPTAR